MPYCEHYHAPATNGFRAYAPHSHNTAFFHAILRKFISSFGEKSSSYIVNHVSLTLKEVYQVNRYDETQYEMKLGIKGEEFFQRHA